MTTATGAWDELIASVYDAALDPGLWPQVITRAAEVLDARQAKIAVTRLPAQTEARPFLHRLDPTLQDRWFTELAEHDRWTQSMRTLPRGFVAAGSQVLPPAELHRSDIYQQFLRPDRVEDIVVAWLGDGPHGIAHVVFYRDRLFDRRQLRLLGRLAPHLRRALRTQERLLDLTRRIEPLESALDRLHAAIYLLAADGRVLFCNRRGEAMARAGDGLGLRHARLHLERPDETRLLDAAVAAAAAAAAGRVPLRAESLAASRRSLRRPLSLLIAPVRPRDQAPWPLLPDPGMLRSAAVLVTVSDPEDAVRPAAEHLVALFRLTPAEARLAAALAARSSLEEYAEQAGITISTARWTLKRVLEKTGCRRQSELVHLLATSAPGLIQA